MDTEEEIEEKIKVPVERLMKYIIRKVEDGPKKVKLIEGLLRVRELLDGNKPS